jgi:hypothetical protein
MGLSVMFTSRCTKAVDSGGPEVGAWHMLYELHRNIYISFFFRRGCADKVVFLDFGT